MVHGSKLQPVSKFWDVANHNALPSRSPPFKVLFLRFWTCMSCIASNCEKGELRDGMRRMRKSKRFYIWLNTGGGGIGGSWTWKIEFIDHKLFKFQWFHFMCVFKSNRPSNFSSERFKSPKTLWQNVSNSTWPEVEGYSKYSFTNVQCS